MLKLIKYCLLFTLLLSISCRRSSNEVLEAFNIMNEKLDESNITTKQEIDSLYNLLKDNKFKTQYYEFLVVSNDLQNYISFIKDEITNNLGKQFNSKSNEEIDYEKLGNSLVSDSILFNNDKSSYIGNKLVEKINKFNKKGQITFKGFPELTKKIKRNFNTDSINKTFWLEYHFKGFPAVATLTKLTQIQSDITQVKRDFLIELVKE